jgi:hypothetical protein
MIELDLQYATTRSLKLDVKILLLTIPAVLTQVHDMCRARWGSAELQTQTASSTGDGKPAHLQKDAPPVRAT